MTTRETSRRRISLARVADDLGSLLTAAHTLAQVIADLHLADNEVREREAHASLATLLRVICRRHNKLAEVLNGEVPPSQLAEPEFAVEEDDINAARELCLSWTEPDEPRRPSNRAPKHEPAPASALRSRRAKA